jgi:hypothetical protein
LILVVNLLPDWKITARWWPPVLFAGLAVWTFTRRRLSGAKLVCIIRWPVILMVLALMLALHAAYFAITFGLTCSVLLIVFGGLLLLERTVGASPVYAEPVAPEAYSGTTSTFHGEAAESPLRAAWEPTDSGTVKSDPVGQKEEL